jgi:hypothetical protein
MSEEILVSLVRFLAERMGQKVIADELNRRELWQPGTNARRWNQTQISRFMKQHNIPCAWSLRTFPPDNYEKKRNVV